ncbi:MAG: signal peptidase I, partial [Acetobacteraceae bacterium]|nr:signal peptidase I [Acetobacteraceae bacterium]
MLWGTVAAWSVALPFRSLVFEPFNIPSVSMSPTLLAGDYLFVSKYSYGYSYASLPFGPHLFSGRVPDWMPARGDVAVFKWPGDNSTDYIKRVIGLPGDRVQVRKGQLYINGAMVPRQPEGDYAEEEGRGGPEVLARRYAEALPGGVTHDILKTRSDTEMNNTPEVRV